MTKRTLRLLLLVLGPAAFIGAGLVLDGADGLSRLRLSIQRTPGGLPSSLVVPRDEIARGVPVLSVYAESDRVFDTRTGLLTNPRARGREWELPAMMSYFDHGRLIFAGGVGFRRHGSNATADTQPRDQSFRLHFRKSHSLQQFMPGILFDGQSDPITRLVVHNDRRRDGRRRWWHFVNPLAYDIARQVGALTPNTQLVRFLLNGDLLGVYVLTEEVRGPFFRSRFGHGNFIRVDDEMLHSLGQAFAQISPLTMVEVDRLLDVESLSRWFVSVLFCATTDPFQGVIFRDQTQPGTRTPWRIANWDMDHSFIDLYGQAQALWFHDTFATTLNRPALESQLLTRLIEEDPSYRVYLARMISDALDRRLTASFLQERFEFYRDAAVRLQVGDVDFLEELELFLVLRGDAVRDLTTRYLDAGL